QLRMLIIEILTSKLVIKYCFPSILEKIVATLSSGLIMSPLTPLYFPNTASPFLAFSIIIEFIHIVFAKITKRQ
ncbi:hypothetical protein, partial [Listeria ivanovii]|uniref:hypothetical protein n=1 Tax=Listeria ivanovii TaxID=1638 RepID=UPI003CEE486F